MTGSNNLPTERFPVNIKEQYRRETENMSVKEAVRSLFAWPALYEFMPERLKNSFEVAVKASQQSIEQYKLVPSSLRDDIQFTLAVFDVERFGSVESTNLYQIVKELPKKHKKSVKVALKVAKLLPKSIGEFIGNPRNNVRVAKQVVKTEPYLFSRFSRDVKKNIEACLATIKSDFHQYYATDYSIRQNGQLLEAVHKRSLLDFFAICRIEEDNGSPFILKNKNAILKNVNGKAHLDEVFYQEQLKKGMEMLGDEDTKWECADKINACKEAISHVSVEFLDRIKPNESELIEAVSKRKIYLLEKKNPEVATVSPRKRKISNKIML